MLYEKKMTGNRHFNDPMEDAIGYGFRLNEMKLLSMQPHGLIVLGRQKLSRLEV